MLCSVIIGSMDPSLRTEVLYRRVLLSRLFNNLYDSIQNVLKPLPHSSEIKPFSKAATVSSPIPGAGSDSIFCTLTPPKLHLVSSRFSVLSASSRAILQAASTFPLCATLLQATVSCAMVYCRKRSEWDLPDMSSGHEQFDDGLLFNNIVDEGKWNQGGYGGIWIGKIVALGLEIRYGTTRIFPLRNLLFVAKQKQSRVGTG